MTPLQKAASDFIAKAVAVEIVEGCNLDVKVAMRDGRVFVSLNDAKTREPILDARIG